MKNISGYEQMHSKAENPSFYFSNSNNKKRRQATKITSLLVVSLFLLLFPVLTFAQAVSGVTGVVTDISGAIIPGAQVVLFDTKTSRELTVTANDQGVYIFSNVQPGAGY